MAKKIADFYLERRDVRKDHAVNFYSTNFEAGETRRDVVKNGRLNGVIETELMGHTLDGDPMYETRVSVYRGEKGLWVEEWPCLVQEYARRKHQEFYDRYDDEYTGLEFCDSFGDTPKTGFAGMESLSRLMRRFRRLDGPMHNLWAVWYQFRDWRASQNPGTSVEIEN